jgi:hypothetical protein
LRLLFDGAWPTPLLSSQRWIEHSLEVSYITLPTLTSQ